MTGAFDPADTALAGLPDSRTFDPWGKKVATQGARPAVGFQGSWTDPATGEVNMKARWYSTTSGSFDSRDTASYSSGPSILANKYTYGAGDPVTLNDPDGNWPSLRHLQQGQGQGLQHRLLGGLHGQALREQCVRLRLVGGLQGLRLRQGGRERDRRRRALGLRQGQAGAERDQERDRCHDQLGQGQDLRRHRVGEAEGGRGRRSRPPCGGGPHREDPCRHRARGQVQPAAGHQGGGRPGLRRPEDRGLRGRQRPGADRPGHGRRGEDDRQAGPGHLRDDGQGGRQGRRVRVHRGVRGR
ncbi:hypothetical protein G5V59_09750 [Nocardioides sp. W3-2-3]|uniref:RHS repeat-associated core domain-containing protein n=1 Tax=Nocardioides convexus TaxID=2712224 RepID=UPI0024186927|nr:RHS repeat-associated core domain-containing protein [Nocardioides convexus]NHA00292.1 hypothetical protein [Nocardioides convexus]